MLSCIGEELINIEKMRDRVVFRTINREKNSELIADAPHVDYLDLAIVFSIYIDISDGETGSILIRNSLAAKWGVDTDELYRLALMNTPRMLKVSMVSMADTLHEFTDMIIDDDNIQMYVLTNQEKVYGATCILYPGVLKKLRRPLVMICMSYQVVYMRLSSFRQVIGMM